MLPRIEQTSAPKRGKRAQIGRPPEEKKMKRNQMDLLTRKPRTLVARLHSCTFAVPAYTRREFRKLSGKKYVSNFESK
jgi:hypothetical protein